nr:transposase [Legionella londiniensis]
MPGGLYFFTVALQNRKSNLLVEQIDLLKDAFRAVKRTYPFQIKSYVILPDHLHMVWKLPEGDSNYSGRWQRIKGIFSKSINQCGIPLAKTSHNEYRLWQRRFWEHTIKDWLDFENHVNYIHYNPIKHGLVKHLRDWPYSSFHYFVQQSLLNENWAGSCMEDRESSSFGE